MTFRIPAICLAALLLASCGETGPRYLVEPSESDLRVRAAVDTVLVRTVSLPTYAAAEEIAYQDETGAVRTTGEGLWADEPERGATLAISRHLNAMTGVTVAPEPWPLPDVPEAVVDVRVEQMLATNEGTLRLAGQYFVGSEQPDPPEPDFDDEEPPKAPPPPVRARSRIFDIVVPLRGEGLGALGRAQSAAMTELSERIARDLAR